MSKKKYLSYHVSLSVAILLQNFHVTIAMKELMV